MPKHIPWRPILVVVILVATAGLFTDYFVTHPELRRQLGETPPLVIGLLLLLYFSFVGALAMINSAALRLCKTTISASESLLLTMYSSIINFFGPLQSGPAFRAIYLKQKHRVKIRAYTAASLVYYGFYGLFSVGLLFSGLLKWWLLPLIILAVILIYYLRHSSLRAFQAFKQFDLVSWLYMAGASLLQVSILALIFFVELRAIAPDTSVSQALIYTGAANLALFVSITPGAIGFRESFLLLSENLHHIDATTIVAANLIDRSVYILLLLILVAGIFGLNINRRFQPKA